MRIGIDIDGVLTDIEKFQIDYGSKFYYEKYNKRVVEKDGYETNEIFNTSEKNDDKFWLKYFLLYELKIKTRNFSSKIIKKIRKEKHEVYIITARGNFLSKNKILYGLNKFIVKFWLFKNKIKYDKIIFTNDDKINEIKKYKIDVMIEDKPDNITKISRYIPVLCYDAEYNEQLNGRNIIRCYSWYDIYSKIGTIDVLK